MNSFRRKNWTSLLKMYCKIKKWKNMRVHWSREKANDKINKISTCQLNRPKNQLGKKWKLRKTSKTKLMKSRNSNYVRKNHQNKRLSNKMPRNFSTKETSMHSMDTLQKSYSSLTPTSIHFVWPSCLSKKSFNR